MRRRLFNLAVAFSLLSAIVAIVGVVRSPFVYDALRHFALTRGAGGRRMLTMHFCYSIGGSLVLGRASVPLPASAGGGAITFADGPALEKVWDYGQGPATSFETLGKLQFIPPSSRSRDAVLFVPWWAVALAGGVLPVWKMRHWLMARAQRARGFEVVRGSTGFSSAGPPGEGGVRARSG
jgi:hypothetical protein